MEDMRSLNTEELGNISSGYVVEGAQNQYWIVRQDGSVIAPVPDRNKAVEFASQLSVSTTILTLEEYKAKFGRELVW